MDKNNDFINAGKFISQGRGRRHPVRVIDSAELICVVSGKLEMFEGEKCYTVEAGNYLLLSPGIRHGGTAPYPQNLIFFWAHFTPEEDFSEHLRKTGRIADPEKLVQAFDFLLSEQQSRNDHEACNILFSLILHEISLDPDQHVIEESGNTLAQAAKRLITLRYTDNISTAKVAEILHCNADYLGRLYHKVYNASLLEDLCRIRLKHAAALLREETLTIKEIAFSCGFNDLAYFRRRFFRQYSVRPGQYRKMYASSHINTE
jgi:AraC-like DNA-binding protein